MFADTGLQFEGAPNHGFRIGRTFSVGSWRGSKAPVIFKDQSLRLNLAIGRDGLAREHYYPDLSIDGTVFLGDDIARLSERP